jgi:4-methyl-5(b-hydroxyethyl)-thiazole monophosphate biosynthesis
MNVHVKKVLLLLANGFEMYEASVFIDVIGWNYVSGDRLTQLYSCGLTKEINTAFKQKVIVDYTVDEIVVDEFVGLIRKFHEQNKLVVSICTGAIPIAKSGILAGKNGTTYKLSPKNQGRLREMGVNVVNKPIVEDSNIITSWNPSTAMDVAFLLLERLTTQENSLYIKEIMGFKL